MGQESQAFAHRGEIAHFIPKASVNLSSGDYVVMPRNNEPISRARLGNEAQISPLGAAWNAQWGVGIVDSDFTTNTVGSTLFATPTTDQALPVIRRGVVRLAINKTSAKAGDLVIYASGATGAQVFTTNNFRRDIAVARVFKDFSGATSGDTQLVELIEKSISSRDIYFWLQNRVLQGCKVKKRSLNSVASTQVNAGATGEINMFVVKGKFFTVPRKTAFVLGAINPGSSSSLRFWWVNVKVSTTGAGAGWAKRTGTGPFGKFASFTNSQISCGMMIPITFTSNEIPAALVIAFSTTQYTIGQNRILNLNGPDLPNGINASNHSKWYL